MSVVNQDVWTQLPGGRSAPRSQWAGELGLQRTLWHLKRLVALREGHTSLTTPTEGGHGGLPGGGLAWRTQGPEGPRPVHGRQRHQVEVRCQQERLTRGKGHR